MPNQKANNSLKRRKYVKDDMMKKIIILLIIITIIFTGCSKDNIRTETQKDSTSVLQIPNGKMGNISFEPDTSRSTSVEYFADGSEVSLSVTDESGMEWTLTIPKNALRNKEKITMTPMTGIESRTFPGMPASGVILEPDGLQFLSSATISIRKSDSKLKGLILSGDHQGSGLEFSQVSVLDNGVVAPVLHFSTIVFDPADDPDIKELQRSAEKQFREAERVAKEILRRTIEVPSPPSVSLECLGESQYEIAREYANVVVQPEDKVLGALLAAGRSVSIMGGDMNGKDFELAGQLVERIMKKVDALIKTYQPQPEKLPAVYHAAMYISRWASLLGTDNINRFAAIGRWAALARDQCMDQLRNGHKYKLMGAIVEFDKMAGIWNMQHPDMFEKIEKAFAFKLIYDLIYDSEETKINVSGEAKLKPVFATNHNILEGFGNAEYVSINVTYTNDKFEIQPKTFVFKTKIINFEPCSKEPLSIVLDRFGSEDEEYIVTDSSGFTASKKNPLIEIVSGFVFERTYESFEDGGYLFKLPLRNEQATAAVANIKKSDDTGFTMNLHLQVEHTPQ